ncbi:hypothetical protein [Nonomuraea terrae]|nr:hypothetical protein [Nonomuraea terrae]
MVTVVQASTEIDLEDAEVARKQTKDTDRELARPGLLPLSGAHG